MTLPTGPRPRYREFFVPGIPAPQGSKKHVGNGITVESSKRLPEWRQRVRTHSHNVMGGNPSLTIPVHVELHFILPRPKNLSQRANPPASKRPDIDKLTRAVLDAITGTIIADDAQVIKLVADKYVAYPEEPPGVYIFIDPFKEEK